MTNLSKVFQDHASDVQSVIQRLVDEMPDQIDLQASPTEDDSLGLQLVGAVDQLDAVINGYQNRSNFRLPLGEVANYKTIGETAFENALRELSEIQGAVEESGAPNYEDVQQFLEHYAMARYVYGGLCLNVGASEMLSQRAEMMGVGVQDLQDFESKALSGLGLAEALDWSEREEALPSCRGMARQFDRELRGKAKSIRTDHKNSGKKEGLYASVVFSPKFSTWALEYGDPSFMVDKIAYSGVDIGRQWPTKKAASSGDGRGLYPYLALHGSVLIGSVQNFMSNRYLIGPMAGLTHYAGDWFGIGAGLGTGVSVNRMNFGAGFVPERQTSFPMVGEGRLHIFPSSLMKFNENVAMTFVGRYETHAIGEPKHHTFVLGLGASVVTPR